MSDVAEPYRFQRYCRARLSEPESFATAGGTVVVFTAPSPDQAERVNEDAALLASLPLGRAVFCVADGAGGLRRGELASQMVLETLESTLSDENSPDLHGAVVRAFEQAHTRIAAEGIGAATTLAGVMIEDQRLRSFHAGDSRVLVSGQRGRRKLVTLPHSPVAYAMEAGLLNEQEALRHDKLHLVSNLVGIEGARIDVSSSIELARFDTVVIASDGLFDNFLEDEIVEHMRRGALLEVMTELVRETHLRMLGKGTTSAGKPDDLTILLYRRQR
jgi:serine/threonine protein phosphatase PrpC